MPKFHYQGVNKSGKDEHGVIDAESETSGLRLLSAQGISAYNLNVIGSEKLKPWYLRDITLLRSGVSAVDVTQLSDIMAVLFDAGLPTLDVLRITKKSVSSPNMQKQLERVEFGVQEGAGLYDAFKTRTEGFPPLFLSFLRVGDRANATVGVLKDAATYFRTQNALRSGLFSAVLYPAILIVAAFLLLAMVIFYLAPSLAPIFQANGAELPNTLARLMAVNEFVYAFWESLVAATLLLALLMAVAFQRGWILALGTGLLSRLPMIKRLQIERSTAQISRSFSLLLAAGLPLEETVNELAIVFRNSVLGASLADAAKEITQGGTGAKAFSANPSIPAIFSEVYLIGSEVNRLPQMLPSVTNALEESLKNTLQRLMVILTPTLTLLIGGGIGFLVYTLMGAILDINEIAF